MLVAVKSHSCPSWRFQRLSSVGQLGFFDSGNADIVSVEESQQFSDFATDYDRVPLHQSQTVSESWCRDRSWVHLDIGGTLKQKSEKQCRYWPLRHQKADLTSRERSEVLVGDSVGR